MRVKGVLATALCVVGFTVSGLGGGSALADPDQPPVDPQVVDSAPVPVQPPPMEFPPPPPPLPGDLAAPVDVPPPPVDVPPPAPIAAPVAPPAVTMSAANTGTFALVLARPLASITLSVAGLMTEKDLLNQIPSLPEIKDGACLTWLWGAGAATAASTTFAGGAEFVWG